MIIQPYSTFDWEREALQHQRTVYVDIDDTLLLHQDFTLPQILNSSLLKRLLGLKGRGVQLVLWSGNAVGAPGAESRRLQVNQVLAGQATRDPGRQGRLVRQHPPRGRDPMNRFCVTCAWSNCWWTSDMFGAVRQVECRHPQAISRPGEIDPVTGMLEHREYTPASIMRNLDRACGPTGKLWRPGTLVTMLRELWGKIT